MPEYDNDRRPLGNTATPTREPIKDKGGLGWLWVLLGLLLLGLLAWLLFNSLNGDDDATSKDTTAKTNATRTVGTDETTGTNLTVADLNGTNADQYFGTEVAVTEEISEKVSDTAILLGGDSDQLDVPVVGITPQMFQDSAPALDPKLRARVTGQAVEFQQSEFATEYDPAFADAKYKDYEGHLAIVASAIDIDPNDDGGAGESNG